MGSILAVINVPWVVGKVDSELGFYPNGSESPCKNRLHLQFDVLGEGMGETDISNY